MGRHGSRERKAWSLAKEPAIEKGVCCSCVHFRSTLVLELTHRICDDRLQLFVILLRQK